MTNAPNPSVACARVLIDELARNGVQHLVCSPGSRSAPLAVAAWDHPQVRVWVTIDERSAGYLALGIGKTSGVPAAVVTTSGTAVANLLPAVVEADASYTPMVVVTADRPPELREVGANQTIDQVGIFGRKVRWFFDLPPAEDRPFENRLWRSVVCRLVAESLGRPGPPGPVHLNVGFREPLMPVTDDGRTRSEPYRSDLSPRPDGGPWTRRDREPPVPTPGRVPGRRPLVVVGDRPLDAEVAEVVPVVAEGHSGSRLPTTITTAHHVLAREQPELAPDVVVTLGRAGLSPRVATLIGRAPRHVAVSPWGWPDPGRSADAVLHALGPGSFDPEPGWRERWIQAEGIARSALDEYLDGLEQPTEPRAVRDAARAAIRTQATLVVGSSLPVRLLDWFGPPGAVRVVANRGASGIDGTCSLALGVAAAGVPTVAVVGDLALLHDMSAFLVEPRPTAVLVVLDNQGGGIFRLLPQAGFPDYLETLFTTPRYLDLANLAVLHHLSYLRLERAADLGEAIERSVSEAQSTLIHVRVDPDGTARICAEATEQVQAALADWFKRGRTASPPA